MQELFASGERDRYSAEWYETAVFDEEDHRWVIDDNAESQLDLKYRAQANNRNAPEL
jgi:hypothetical protein